MEEPGTSWSRSKSAVNDYDNDDDGCNETIKAKDQYIVKLEDETRTVQQQIVKLVGIHFQMQHFDALQFFRIWTNEEFISFVSIIQNVRMNKKMFTVRILAVEINFL